MRISDWSSDVCSSDLSAGKRGSPCWKSSCDSSGSSSRPSAPRSIRALRFRSWVPPCATSVARQPDRSLRESGGAMRLRRLAPQSASQDRKRVVEGTSVSVRVDLGGRRIYKKKKKKKK